MTWIQTFTGKAFDLLDPKPETVCIEDIAHHLALINRFTGATREPYSVAQHSVLCSWIVPPELALTALLHDAAEAYVADVSRPLKEAMRQAADRRTDSEWTPYDYISERIECAVGQRFGVELVDLDPRVKHADLVMLATERVHFHGSAPRDWDLGVEAYDFPEETIAPWSWRSAEDHFLGVFRLRGGK
jgi:hypothetical protein